MFHAEKSFACDIDGCTMKFINEDHYTIHKKKHDMILNLGSSKGNFFSDQTPTPTRFIRNCEEVGLFQDLQNVNPFEETFKKAVESVKSGGTQHLRFPSHAPDDSLHTPNIFPNISDIHAPLMRDLSVETPHHVVTAELHKDTTLTVPENIIQSNNVISPVTESFKETLKLKPKEAELKAEESITESLDKNKIQVMMKVPGGKMVQFFAEEVDTKQHTNKDACQTVVINASGEKPNTKILLKEKLLKDTNMIPVTRTDVILNKVPIPKLPTVPNSNHFTSFKSFTTPLNSNLYSSTNWHKSKRRKDCVIDSRSEIQERNRAAALRSRQKKKQYIKHLETLNYTLKVSNDYLVETNTKLMEEVKALRTALLQQTTNQLNLPQCVPSITLNNNSSEIEEALLPSQSDQSSTVIDSTDCLEIEILDSSEDNDIVRVSTPDPLFIPQYPILDSTTLSSLTDIKILGEHCYFTSSLLNSDEPLKANPSRVPLKKRGLSSL